MRVLTSVLNDKIKSDIDMALDNGYGTMLVLLDKSAAFDTASITPS